ncbi:lipocalin-like domain-containing protein [Nitratireductor sp. XY-223]|uniref:lipocalin-like domain-containing protein n=1 Tax=Nitratireductor sp. XY-223 TaxID=2561926 RepID=UPI0010AB073F|nr:lipocalin-like domain-containing protein [Nitratireductor sp. XY-223]
MNAKLLALPLVLLTYGALAQGFAGLGTDAEGFSVPEAGRELSFPRDHGPHPDFRIEWWYLTANLKGENGADYGLQWTLFRSALRPEAGEGWSASQTWMAHAAVTTDNSHFSTERFARGGIGQAGVRAEPFSAWIDDWRMTSRAAPGEDPLAALEVFARGPDFTYDIALTASGPLVLHGENGFSVKSASGQASHYYSQPFYSVRGTIDLPTGRLQVSGQAWLDREWSSQPLDPDQTGWDWLSLHFDDGAKLMGFRLRSRSAEAFTSATWIGPNGKTTSYGDGALKMTPGRLQKVAGREVPVEWRLQLAEHDLDITVEAINPNSWMHTLVPYWEGPVTAQGSRNGRGYLEMTGYE